MKASKQFGLTESDRSILIELLQRFDLKARVFGSRVRGKENEFSDLDLCLDGTVSLDILAQLQESLEASPLPIIVDVSRYEDLSPTFQALVDQEGVLIPEE